MKWLGITDMSSNGTFVDDKKLRRGRKIPLKHGTEICVENRAEHEKIAFTFELVAPPPSPPANRNIHDKYNVEGTLGSGAFAVVKLATHRKTGKRFARSAASVR